MIYVSNHKSHTDYLVELLVIDDLGIRPPLIAAGINLFVGPLGLINRHVTGAIPIRRNTKDPIYLITLKAYVAEVLKRHDLFFYFEGGRSYSGEIKAPQDRAAARRDAGGGARRPDCPRGDRLRHRARGSRARAPGRHEAPAAAVRRRACRDAHARCRIQDARVRDVRRADSHDGLFARVPARRARSGAPHPRRDRQAVQGPAHLAGRRVHAAVDRPEGPGGARRRPARAPARGGRQSVGARCPPRGGDGTGRARGPRRAPSRGQQGPRARSQRPALLCADDPTC